MKTLKLLAIFLLLAGFSTQAQERRESSRNINYFFSRYIDGSMEDVTKKLKTILKEEGFSVVTEIKMDETLKEKIDIEMKPYHILGVCNAQSAHQAILAEPNIGVMLPCKIVIKEVDERTIEVVSVNPIALMEQIGNGELSGIAQEISAKLNNIVEGL